mmetsp:Transcript_3305/g.5075  ORF Transcript_3305/g.5075 Transcript_3305/m.5075 type:complete len:504 (+) Transcript_3305:27-1538(+)
MVSLVDACKREKREREELLRTPADRRYALYHAAETGGLPTIVSTCIAINAIVGSGFLALPRLFAAVGLGLSCTIVVLVTVVMTLTTSWEAESMARAEALSRSQLERAAPLGSLFSRMAVKREIISNRSFEMTEMSRLFCGQTCYVLCAGIILIYLGCTLVAYAFVFAESLATELPAFGFEQRCPPDSACGLYKAYCALFACIVTPLSMLDPNEQVTFQVAMSILRFLVALIMTFSSLYEYFYGPGILFTETVSSHDTASHNLQSVAFLLPAIVFALNVNGSLPLIAKSMRHKDQVHVAIRAGLWISACMYICIASSVALAFGPQITKSANVAWERFTTSNILPPDSIFASFLQALATLVILFPAADVLSIYPLTAIVIANNLLAVFFGDKADKAQHSHTISRLFRLLVSFPPVLCACFVPNFSKIVDATGVFAVFISCIFPPLLSIFGKRACRTELENSSLDITKFTLDRGALWSKGIVFFFALVVICLLALTPQLTTPSLSS